MEKRIIYFEKMISIILGNIIEAVIFIGSIIANAQINRRKYLYWWALLNVLGAFAFFVLYAYDGAISKAYNAVRIIILLLLYRDDKIIPGKFVSLILGMPFLMLMYFNYKMSGYLGIIYGLAMFITTQDFIFKKETSRFMTKIVSDIGLILYDIAKYDFVGLIRHIAEVTTFAIDIYIVKKNGEKIYYKK